MKKPRITGALFVSGNLQFAQHIKGVFVIGLLAKFIDLGESNLALLVHNKDGPLVDPGNGIAFAQNAVVSGGFSMRKEIADEWEIQLANRLLLPRNVAGY
ncbi:MAG: hypothetical protein JWN45_3424 [Acidobacteriaceae bacterium]|nr:hypothetical protein [Acidobacteriaceae bacterium]